MVTFVKCSVCGKTIRKEPGRIKGNKTGRFFCRECRVSLDVNCSVCGKQLRKWRSQIVGKKKICCSVECKKISQRKDWNELARRQIKTRWISQFGKESLICNRCGHDKPYNIELHHKQYVCNEGSNLPENLEPLCKNCHGEEHYHRPDKDEVGGS